MNRFLRRLYWRLRHSYLVKQEYIEGYKLGSISIPYIAVLDTLRVSRGLFEPEASHTVDLGPVLKTRYAPLGEAGISVIGAHRTTYTAPFFHLHHLRPNDSILLEVEHGPFRYRVTGADISDVEDVESRVGIYDSTLDLDRENPDKLVLMSCHPKGSTKQRLLVFATAEDS